MDISQSATRFLTREDGRIAYDVQGLDDGPLVVGIPGMGDLRSSYRLVAPALLAAGCRVATMDLRGHGDSDTTFARYDSEAAGTDAVALVEELGGGPAVLLGSSFGAAAAVVAAATRPELVRGLVLLGPFVRTPQTHQAVSFVQRAMLTWPWGPTLWSAYYTGLHRSVRPADLAAHRSAIEASLRDRDRWRAFVATTRGTHDASERLLPDVQAPAVVVMGTRDRDFPSPRKEAAWIADALHGEAFVLHGLGHYPHAEHPEDVVPKILALAGVSDA